MKDIRKRCEDVLVDLVSQKPENGCLADLPFAQFYKLEKVIGTIVNKARQLTLSDFKIHEIYENGSPHLQTDCEGNYRKARKKFGQLQEGLL